MSTAVPCPRCGRAIGIRQLARHEELCARMPLPDKLAAIYLAERCYLSDLAKRYGVREALVRKHLRQAGLNHFPTHDKECPRCGLKVSPARYRDHRDLCRRLPLPGDLLQALEAGESVAEMSRRYGVTYYALTGRITLARQQAEFGAEHCRVCGILLGHPAVERAADDEALCADCATRPCCSWR